MNQEKACDKSSQNRLHPRLENPPRPRRNSPRVWESEELLAGRQEVLIRQHGEVYRLRLTRNDKLILNK